MRPTPPFDPATLLPGLTLKPLTNGARAAVEDALQRFLIERTVRATVGLAAGIRKDVIADTATNAAYFLCGDTTSMRAAVHSADGRLATLTAAASVGQGGAVDADDVRAKVDRLSADAVGAAVDWCWGWGPAAS